MHEADKALSVRFYMMPKENPRKSKEEGRPIFENIEMVSIMAAGNTKTEVNAPAHEIAYNGNISAQQTYAERFPEHYDAFKRGVEEQAIGTPLSELTFLSPAERAEMQAKNIRTVEQLAHMSDANIRKMGQNFRHNVEKAKDYLSKTGDNAAVLAELEALRKQVAEMTGEPVKGDEEPVDESLAAFEDEDLKNMIRDAGGEVPRGKASRATLEAKLREIAAEKEDA